MEYDDIRPYQRVQLRRDVDRYPHGVFMKGLKGHITSVVRGHHGVPTEIRVTLDFPYESLKEWDNAIIWDDESYPELVETFTDEVMLVDVKLRVTFNRDWNEYSVRWIEDGKTNLPKSYFCDDKADAVATMEAMAARHGIKDFK